MSEMVDKVAAAIAGYLTPMSVEKVWNNQLDEDKEHYRAQARAAIEAMREPTEEMKAPEGIHWDYSCHVCGGLKDGWHGMIDAALGKVDA